METRKVQLSGGTTYTISLPKSWATEHGIDAGSLVALHPNGDGSLLVEVAGEGESTERTATVDVATTTPSALEQRVVALYTVGYDSVTLVDRTGHPEDRRRAVERAIDGLSGLEVLEATDTRLELLNLIDAENVDVRKSALRLRLVALSMHADAVTAVETGDDDLARRVVERDSEADKLFAMVTRHFRRSLSDLHEVEKLDHSRDELFEYYYVCRQLERVADHAEKMSEFVVDDQVTLPEPLVTELRRLSDRARSVVDDAADVVLAGADVEVAHGALDTLADLVADIEATHRGLYDDAVTDPEAAYAAGLLLDSIERTAQYGGNVAEIGVQRTVRSEAGE